MNRYQPPIPRAALGIAALAMTAVTVALVVVLPANIGTSDEMRGTLATASAVSPGPTEVVINPSRIDVVGVRGREFASAQARDVDPKCRQQEI